MTEIPLNATIRQEYVKCGNPDCHISHGPYLYAYWKHEKKLKKIYLVTNTVVLMLATGIPTALAAHTHSHTRTHIAQPICMALG
jgi:hypothetical protein